MKPWQNPNFYCECQNCGRTGWSPNGMDSWFGAKFYCTGGCDPGDVARYQAAKRAAVIRAIRDRELVVSEGAGI